MIKHRLPHVAPSTGCMTYMLAANDREIQGQCMLIKQGSRPKSQPCKGLTCFAQTLCTQSDHARLQRVSERRCAPMRTPAQEPQVTTARQNNTLHPRSTTRTYHLPGGTCNLWLSGALLSSRILQLVLSCSRRRLATPTASIAVSARTFDQRARCLAITHQEPASA